MKITALLALFIVALSPFAAAQEVSVDASVDVTATVDADNDRSPRANKTNDRMQETRTNAKDASVLKAEVGAKARVEARSIKDIEASLKECRGKRTDDCAQKRSEAKLSVKASLIKAADSVLELLGKTKARLAESNAPGKDAAIADLDLQITAVTQAKATVETLNETSTRADIQRAAKDLRSAINDARESLRAGAHKLVALRLGGVIQKSEHLENRLENALAKLESQGVDTSTVNLDAFEAKLDTAASLHVEAMASYDAAQSASGKAKSEAMKTATQKLRDSHKALKEAHKILQEMLKELKALRGGNQALNEASSEESEDDEEDNESEDDDETVNASVEANVSTEVNVTA
ncbi:hypothetical protein J4219_02330 [Candidatus Woesearchaeota archaeon]|nr:hypothetical protein [Candidatus Woesearchaeota archaeon]